MGVVKVEPFGWDLYVVTTKKAAKAAGLDFDDMGFVATKGGLWYMGLPRKFDIGTLYHECHHCARLMNDEAGIVTTAQDHEADVYLMESIAREVATVIYNRTIK